MTCSAKANGQGGNVANKKEEVHINVGKLIGGGYNKLFHSKDFYRVVKGGRASKKSTTAAIWFIYSIMKYPMSNLVVVRQVGNTHKNSTFAELKKAALRLGVYHLWSFIENPLQAVYKRVKESVQKILFYGFDDPMKLTSLTVEQGYLCWAWFEEIFEVVNEEDFDMFIEGIRGIVPAPLWKQVTLTYNPWVSTHWTMNRFWGVDCPPNTFRLTTTHRDNEFLDESDHERIERLAETNPERYKVVGLGEYGIPGGAFFDEFREDTHVCEPFDIPDYWHRYTSKDYGLDMLAQVWVAVDSYNNAYIYKEINESGLIVSEAVDRINEVNGNDDVQVKYAPPDLNNRQKDSGKSIFDLFAESGEILNQSDNKRISGWMAVKEWLKVVETRNLETGETEKTSRLKIFSNCKSLIRCMQQIASAEDNPNDAATEPHNITHLPDALRYFCVMRQCPVSAPEEKRIYDERTFDKPPVKEQETYTGGEITESYISY